MSPAELDWLILLAYLLLVFAIGAVICSFFE